MKPTFLLLFALILAPLAHAVPMPIAGTVRDGTGGDRPLPNTLVQLIRPGDGDARKVLAVTRTNAAGQFAFPAREWGKDDLLMANVPHQGYDYFAVAYDGGNKLEKVGMTVNPAKVDVMTFDTTTQAVPLEFQVHHLAIQSTATGLNVIERIVVLNKSQKTFLGVGPRRISVLLDIPKAAKNIKLDPKITDSKMVKTASGWGIERPITPEAYGARNALIFSYDLDWPSKLPWAKKLDLSHEINYPTQFFFVARLPDDKNLEVEAPLLGQSTEAQLPIDGQTQTRLVNSIGAPQMPGMPGGGDIGPVLPAGKQMPITIERPVNPLFWAFAALTLGLVVFLPIAMIKPLRANSGAKSAEPGQTARVKLPTSAPGSATNGSATSGSATNGTAVSSSAADGSAVDGNVADGISAHDLTLSPAARALIAQIAQLDDEHEAGRIAEDAYHLQRAAWKEQLMQYLE